MTSRTYPDRCICKLTWTDRGWEVAESHPRCPAEHERENEMKLRSRIDTIDGWLQTAKEMLMQDAGKYDDHVAQDLDQAAGAIGLVQDKLREISEADGWRDV